MRVESTKELVRDHLSDLEKNNYPKVSKGHSQLIFSQRVQVSKGKLSDDRARKGDVSQEVFRIRRLPQIAVLNRKNSDDRSDDLDSGHGREAQPCQHGIQTSPAAKSSRE